MSCKYIEANVAFTSSFPFQSVLSSMHLQIRNIFGIPSCFILLGKIVSVVNASYLMIVRSRVHSGGYYMVTVILKRNRKQVRRNRIDSLHSRNERIVISFKTLLVITVYCTVLYYTILYYTILYYTILYYTILYYTIPYCTIPHYILYYIILYHTIIYHTILNFTTFYCITPNYTMQCSAVADLP